MSNSLLIEDIPSFLECSSCGVEFTTQEELDKLIYVRTTASGDHYKCPYCGSESISLTEEFVSEEEPLEVLTKEDMQIIERIEKDEPLSDIVEEMFPATDNRTSFELFYAQTKLPIGDMMRSHFGGEMGGL